MLLEREDHLEALVAAFARVRDGGRGTLAVVVGEAGAGKTSLVRCLAAEHVPAGDVLWGACDSLRTPRPLGPIADIAAGVGGPVAAALDDDAGRDRVFTALLDHLRTLPRPQLVVVEDAHWADEATLDVLTLLGRRIGQTRALVVLTYRDDELDAGHPLRVLLGDVGGQIGCRVPVRPLSLEAVTVLAGDHAADPAELYAVTAGNPFYVTECLAAGATTVPATVRDAVLARAARLTPGARQVLDGVAVVPGGVDLELLDALVDEAGEALDACVEAGVLTAGAGVVTFRHELARLAIEDTVAPARRRALHRAALQALRKRGGVPDARLAFHAAEAGDVDAVLVHAPAAADHAAALGAHREAVTHLAQALRHAERVTLEQRADLWARQAAELYLVGRPDDAVDAYARAVEGYRELGDPAREGELLVASAGPRAELGDQREAAEAIGAAIDLLEGLGPSPELAVAYAGRCAQHMLARKLDEAERWAQRSIELCERLGRRDHLCFVLIQSGVGVLMAGDEAGHLRILRGMAIARAEGWDHRVGLGLLQIGSGAGEVRRYDLAVPALREAIAFCDDRDLLAQMRYCQAWLARCELEQGHWDEAAALAGELVAKPSTTGVTRLTALTVLGKLRARRGDPGAWPALDEALALARANGHLQRLWPAAAARAEAAWLDGHALGDEVTVVEEAHRLATGLAYPWAVDELSFWLWRAGQAIPDPDPVPGAEATTPFALHRRGDAAGAAAAWSALGCPYEAALAGADSDDVDAVEAAHAELTRLGARPAAGYTAARLRALGGRAVRGPNAATRANPFGLTPREVDVAGLLARQLTNAEIAARLFISAKTVDHHVSSILTKLGVGTRREAARLVDPAADDPPA
ncbi:MAG TPA: AAA family ATPase [Acidimicrobiales bacterium]|nr:AAA family ATPase [Acidimicrobiales bacterium]